MDRTGFVSMWVKDVFQGQTAIVQVWQEQRENIFVTAGGEKFAEVQKEYVYRLSL